MGKNQIAPDWPISSNGLYSITRTADEISIVCQEENIPEECFSEKDFRALKVEGPLDFKLTGILTSLLNPLAEAGISVFVLSTYDTDYILIKAEAMEPARAVLGKFCIIK